MVVCVATGSPSVEQSRRRSFTKPSSLGPSRRHTIVVGQLVPHVVTPNAPEKAARPQREAYRCVSTAKPPRDPQATSTPTALGSIHLLGPYSPEIDAAIHEIQLGFQSRVAPVAVDDGVGGVYYLRSKTQRIVGVFKPADEEPFAANNPKAHRPSHTSSATWIRPGIAPGGGAIREVLAHVLHRDLPGTNLLTLVPATAIVHASHPVFFTRTRASNQHPVKIGSLQVYVPHDCAADDVAERMLSVSHVHAMAILDIRLANQDRHGGNVLVTNTSRQRRRSAVSSSSSSSSAGSAPSYEIVPIDHGACLPVITQLSETCFQWRDWPQADVPFNDEMRDTIAAFNGDDDVQRLSSLLDTSVQSIEPEAWLTLAVCTCLLQVCVLEFDMTAAAIAALMCRDDLDVHSDLERLVALALEPQQPHDVVQRFERLLRDHLSSPF